MEDISRRDALSRMAGGCTGLALGLRGNSPVRGEEPAGLGAQASSTQAMARVFSGQHSPKPLAFDPAKLKGLSEKLVKSHWETPSIQVLRTTLDETVFAASRIDVFTMFFAGNGGVKAGNYYLCLSDTDPERMSTTALLLVSLFAIINGRDRDRRML